MHDLQLLYFLPSKLREDLLSSRDLPVIEGELDGSYSDRSELANEKNTRKVRCVRNIFS
jgi:hypothetical protein